MSDIAASLGMSKKTLYTHFPHKEDLVVNSKKLKNKEVSEALSSIRENAKNAIDELITISNYIAHEFGDTNPSMLFDMQKYYPRAWRVHEAFKADFIYNNMISNMDRGIAEGLYRTNFNKDILTRLYLIRLESFFDHEVFPPQTHGFAKVHREFINYHIRGIATPQGIKTLEKYEKD